MSASRRLSPSSRRLPALQRSLMWRVMNVLIIIIFYYSIKHGSYRVSFKVASAKYSQHNNWWGFLSFFSGIALYYYCHLTKER